MALRAGVLYPSTPLREQREPVMPVTENTPRQMVLKSGSTTDARQGCRQSNLAAQATDLETETDRGAAVRRLRRHGRHRRRPRFGRRGLSHHAGPAHRRSLGTAGRGQKRCRDQCVCNPRLSGAPDLAPPSVGTLSAPTAEWVAEKFHVQEQLAGGVVRPVRHAGPHRVLSRRCDHWLHRAATDHAL